MNAGGCALVMQRDLDYWCIGENNKTAESFSNNQLIERQTRVLALHLLLIIFRCIGESTASINIYKTAKSSIRVQKSTDSEGSIWCIVKHLSKYPLRASLMHQRNCVGFSALITQWWITCKCCSYQNKYVTLHWAFCKLLSNLCLLLACTRNILIKQNNWIFCLDELTLEPCCALKYYPEIGKRFNSYFLKRTSGQIKLGKYLVRSSSQWVMKKFDMFNSLSNPVSYPNLLLN